MSDASWYYVFFGIGKFRCLKRFKMNISYPSSVQQSASVLAYFSAYVMMPLRDTILTMVLCALRTWHSSQNNIFSYCFGLFEESRRQCDGPLRSPLRLCFRAESWQSANGKWNGPWVVVAILVENCEGGGSIFWGEINAKRDGSTKAAYGMMAPGSICRRSSTKTLLPFPQCTSMGALTWLMHLMTKSALEVRASIIILWVLHIASRRIIQQWRWLIARTSLTFIVRTTYKSWFGNIIIFFTAISNQRSQILHRSQNFSLVYRCCINLLVHNVRHSNFVCSRNRI